MAADKHLQTRISYSWNWRSPLSWKVLTDAEIGRSLAAALCGHTVAHSCGCTSVSSACIRGLRLWFVPLQLSWWGGVGLRGKVHNACSLVVGHNGYISPSKMLCRCYSRDNSRLYLEWFLALARVWGMGLLLWNDSIYDLQLDYSLHMVLSPSPISFSGLFCFVFLNYALADCKTGIEWYKCLNIRKNLSECYDLEVNECGRNFWL